MSKVESLKQKWVESVIIERHLRLLLTRADRVRLRRFAAWREELAKTIYDDFVQPDKPST